jgi:hypothetical protein
LMGMQAYAPNGKRIVGTLELVPGTAGISEGTWERDPAGGFKFEYDGETKMCWDAQETITRGGQAVYSRTSWSCVRSPMASDMCPDCGYAKKLHGQRGVHLPCKKTYPSREERLEALLRELRADIDAMQLEGQKLWFGPFSEYDIRAAGAEISWPNLAILRDEITDLLTEGKDPVRACKCGHGMPDHANPRQGHVADACGKCGCRKYEWNAMDNGRPGSIDHMPDDRSA